MTDKEHQQVSPKTRAKIVMLERGLSIQDLVKRTDFSKAYVYGLMNGHVVTKRGRAKIEAVLGPIWTEPTDSTMKPPTQTDLVLMALILDCEQSELFESREGLAPHFCFIPETEKGQAIAEPPSGKTVKVMFEEALSHINRLDGSELTEAYLFESIAT